MLAFKGVRRHFSNAFQNHFRKVRFAADAGGVPDEFAVFLRGISPRRLAAAHSLTDVFLRFAEQHRDVFVGMQAVADEERDHHEVSRAGEPVAVADTRVFLHEHGVNFGVFFSRADELDLALDGDAGVFVVARAVAGDEERDVLRFGRARKGMPLEDVAGTGENHVRHARVCADGSAVKKRLRVAPLHAREIGLVVRAQAKFARDDLLGEVAFADEQRHDEYARREYAA